MATPASYADDELSSNIPPFITLPPQLPHACTPQVTQSQTAKNEVNMNAITTTDDHDDTCIHYHDPD